MTSSAQLLGPPAISRMPPSERAAIHSTISATAIDELTSQTTDVHLNVDTGDPPRGFTENRSATYLASGNPCLDFFFHVVPDTPSEQLIERLESAWAHDALTTLKLICNLRGVRGTGKSDKEGFYTAALWLHSKHPKTLSFNLSSIAKFGYFKDFPEILYRILEGPDSRQIQRNEWVQRKRSKKRPYRQNNKKQRRFELEDLGDYSDDEEMEQDFTETEEKAALGNVEEKGAAIDKDQERVVENVEKKDTPIDKEEEGVVENVEKKGTPIDKEQEGVVENVEKKDTPIDKEQEGVVENVEKKDTPTDKEQEGVVENVEKKGTPINKEQEGVVENVEKKDTPIDKEQEGVVENVEKKGNPIDKEQARILRKEREIAKAKKALDRYNVDLNYRLLFDSVADLFAELLKSDMENLKEGKQSAISLAAKWCPSIDSSYDKATLICEAVARKIFPRESEKEYEGIEEAHYAFRVRDRLRKQVLVPLRKALQLPEVYMSAKQWNSLPYERVASVAMKTYKGLFSKHDKERFEAYLGDVKSGKAKIAAGALLPHEIIGSLEDEDGGTVAELQWARMVEDVAKQGKLKNCIAVCDVSSSMSGTPMEVSVALGLLVSELSEEPWKGKVITFSCDPQLHLIQGDTLKEKTNFIREMDWGLNTDFQKVFDKLLAVAVEGKLKEDQLINKIFVFSDMEFDQASSSWYFSNGELIDGKKWEPETDYEVILRKYGEHGYNKVPEIVFWNLRNSLATPTVASQPGVALVSGFSKNLLTLFLEEGGIVNPEQVMGLAIDREEYNKLAVYD